MIVLYYILSAIVLVECQFWGWRQPQRPQFRQFQPFQRQNVFNTFARQNFQTRQNFVARQPVAPPRQRQFVPNPDLERGNFPVPNPARWPAGPDWNDPRNVWHKTTTTARATTTHAVVTLAPATRPPVTPATRRRALATVTRPLPIPIHAPPASHPTLSKHSSTLKHGSSGRTNKHNNVVHVSRQKTKNSRQSQRKVIGDFH